MYYCANAFVVTITLQIYTIILSKKKYIHDYYSYANLFFNTLFTHIYTKR